jgi:hypothetical protein
MPNGGTSETSSSKFNCSFLESFKIGIVDGDAGFLLFLSPEDTCTVKTD